MGARDLSVVSRLKREECERTKHDSQFSDWKVLIGPSDWEDHDLGKEGAVRYRTHNLPAGASPGLYELGIAVCRTDLGREVRRLKSNQIVVVYLGQAENVRTRLQNYGRSGSHLVNRYSDCRYDGREIENVSSQKVGGLFDGVFSRGYPIVYRWASMTKKSEAEKEEAELLDTFDYAWNKGSNGDHRPSDVLERIAEIASRQTLLLNISSWNLLSFTQKKVGIRTKATKPVFPKEERNTHADDEIPNFLSRIFKFNTSQPRRVSNGCNVNEVPICGLILNDGTTCRRPPVLQRKRCDEHKGRKLYAFKSSNSQHLHEESNICGVNLGGEFFCKRLPVVGRKRCEEYKGVRIKALARGYASSSEKKSSNQLRNSGVQYC